MSKKTNQVAQVTEVVTVIEKIRKGFIEKFQKSDEKLKGNFKRDTWAVVKCMNDIYSSENFSKGFESLSDFGECVGYSKSSLSRMVKTYPMIQDAQKMCNEHGKPDDGITKFFNEISYGQAVELLPLYKVIKDTYENPIAQLVQETVNMGLTLEMTQKDIRASVKALLSIEEGDEALIEDKSGEGLNETVEEPETEETEEETVAITFMGETLLNVEANNDDITNLIEELRGLIINKLQDYFEVDEMEEMEEDVII